MVICAQKFIDKLKADGITPDFAERENGVVLVDMGHHGKNIRAVFEGEEGEYFSVAIVFDRITDDKKTEAVFVCNDINSEYKWIKAFVDSDSDLICKLDAKLSPETAADEALEMVLRLAHITDEIKPKVMKAIYA